MWLLQVVQKNKYVIHYCEVCCVILYFFATRNFLEFCFSVLKLVHTSEIYSTLHLDMLLRYLCKYTDMGHDYLITLILFQLYRRKFICIWQTACKAGRQKVIMPMSNHSHLSILDSETNTSPKYTNPKSRKQNMRKAQKGRMYGYVVIMVLWMRPYASTTLHIPYVRGIILLLVRAGRNFFKS